LHEKVSDDFWATDVEGFISLYIWRTPERVLSFRVYFKSLFYYRSHTGESSNQFN